MNSTKIAAIVGYKARKFNSLAPIDLGERTRVDIGTLPKPYDNMNKNRQSWYLTAQDVT
jgi:hypothetical protein